MPMGTMLPKVKYKFQSRDLDQVLSKVKTIISFIWFSCFFPFEHGTIDFLKLTWCLNLTECLHFTWLDLLAF